MLNRGLFLDLSTLKIRKAIGSASSYFDLNGIRQTFEGKEKESRRRQNLVFQSKENSQ